MYGTKDKTAGDFLEISLEKIETLLKGGYNISKRAVALLLLQEDDELTSLAVTAEHPAISAEIAEIVIQTKAHYQEPLTYLIALRRQEEVNRIVKGTVEYRPGPKLPLREQLSRIMTNPVTGTPLLLLILYFGLYKFVGGFGAGTLVNFIEIDIFEKIINPFVERTFALLIPWPVFRDLFAGDYGIITLGIRYAVALILPIVTTFFLVFAVIEDTGYLPRLALLIDRIFKKIGLTGRAVIPIVLGLGCGTMATMVTRTLPTKRERVIATLLLALAVPCSAQMGVILGLLAGNPKALFVWAVVVITIFVLVGYFASMIIPGDEPSFYMEIPPLRLPNLKNISAKTYARVRWYFIEILPMFILASILIWFGQLSGLFRLLTGVLEHPVRWIGLPDQTAVSFLFGFFRRDYGAAGLYDLKKTGLLSGNQLVVACVTLTLFLPCVAQFMMNVKERGWKTGLAISIFVLLFSFSAGYFVSQVLNLLGVYL
ncbi:MAG: ferrous iron transporter B [Candidatus Omnitrophica bacterium]|nr:ferrous iron transporter B [Candidatus Omnitrophota bacterium]